MANRYWVGGAGTWNTASTANWSASSGGASGASAPTAADDVFFDQAGTYTVTVTGGLCRDITVSASTITFSLVTTGPTISGSMSLVAGTVWSGLPGTTFNATTTGKTITTNGVNLSSGMTLNGVGGGWTLGSAYSGTSAGLTINQGSFNSANYAISASTLSSASGSVRSVNLGSSTVTLSGNTVNALNVSITSNLTWNAGTSQINLTGGTTTGINSGGLTFYNVSFATANASITITGNNTFNNLSFAGRSTTGISTTTISGDQTVNGTLTLSSSGVASSRTFLASGTIGTQRTLSVATLAAGAADYDFRDIAVTGAAAPLSVTRAGDCKGNSGITFPAAKTVYRAAATASWGAGAGISGWALTNGGSVSDAAFPLPQDTVVFPSSPTPYPSSGSTVTINSGYNIGTIDMSLRTTNTMTLATGIQSPTIYGNWINGTGTTLTGTGQLNFSGRGSQTITSAGITFTQGITVTTPGGSVTLQDAFTTTSSTQSGLGGGTFDANGYNFTAIGYSSNNTGVRTIAIGSGTWTLNGIGSPWNTPTITNLTVTGTGTISLTNASAKIFNGGGITTYPTLNQGGAGTLTITGANTFANITNTAIGNITFPASTTTTVSAFNVSGNATTRVQLRSSSVGTRFTLSDSSGTVSVDWLDIRDSSATGGAAWYAGANSLNTANNLGWIFTAPSGVIHATTGALNGPGSTIVGSAVRFRAFATTGTLNGQGTIINGSATRFRAFVSSGALDGQGAAVAGSAARFRVFATTGVLDGQGAAIVGSAARLRAFNATGSLFGQGAALSGVASRVHYFTASGALLGPGAAVNGAANLILAHATTGALVGPGSAIAGVSNHISLYPDPADVREGVQYGPGGIYVGTLTVGSGRSIIRLRSFTEEGS